MPVVTYHRAQQDREDHPDEQQDCPAVLPQLVFRPRRLSRGLRAGMRFVRVFMWVRRGEWLDDGRNVEKGAALGISWVRSASIASRGTAPAAVMYREVCKKLLAGKC